MITTKTLVFAALSTTPAAAIVASPAFDWNPIIAALIGAIPPTLGVLVLYLQGRNTAKAVDGVVTNLLKKNTEAAKAEAKVEVAPEILKLSTEKAAAEAKLEAGREEQKRQDTAAMGVVLVPTRRVRKKKPKK